MSTMAQTTLDTISSNSGSSQDVTQPLLEGPTDSSVDNPTEPPPQQDTGTESEGENDGHEDGPDETMSPERALTVIKRQQTHNLFCPNCTTNITKNAELFVKDQEVFPYNQQPLVIWIPLVFPFPPFHRLGSFLSGPWMKLKTLVLNCWPRLTPNSINFRFLFVAILLLLSLIVLWSLPPPPPPPLPLPEHHLDEKLSWLIHLPNIEYLNVLPLLFLALLALCWPQIYSLLPWTRRGPQTNPDGTAVLPSTNQDEVISPTQVNPPPPTPVDPPRPTPVDPPPPTPNPNPIPGPQVIPIPIRWILNKLIPWEIEILEIVKSIVYGGLIESITSLGVVSSAAASGASTLNVLALGVANLFSGLFLIIHSLYGLITFQPLSHSANRDHHVTDLEGETLYRDRLGSFRNVKLHCFVVVVSFIFFGVIPPLFYGLSFKRTDKGHYKAAVVLAVSLVCVIFLSFGKAWAFRMAKLKTVAQYTGMAVGASAISFITSQIVSDVLEKYGFHELASDYRKV